jgi:hypothetical protein
MRTVGAAPFDDAGGASVLCVRSARAVPWGHRHVVGPLTRHIRGLDHVSMNRYPVNARDRAPLIDRIAQALEVSGAAILSRPDPSSAPFEFKIRTPQNETVDLVVYAFLANKYDQEGRPDDENRFQIKYGSDFNSYHDIYIDPTRKKVTLMLGVHMERDLFIAVDPAMHNPTRFSVSVEFKDADLDATATSGWHGWERERSEGRRKEVKPKDDLRTEVLLGLTAPNFMRYVMFERVACGLDSGERLLLLDQIGQPKPVEPGVLVHPLEHQLGLTAHEILDVLGGSFRVRLPAG